MFSYSSKLLIGLRRITAATDKFSVASLFFASNKPNTPREFPAVSTTIGKVIMPLTETHLVCDNAAVCGFKPIRISELEIGIPGHSKSEEAVRTWLAVVVHDDPLKVERNGEEWNRCIQLFSFFNGGELDGALFYIDQ